MNEDRRLLVARISAEILALTNLNEVCKWLVERRHIPERLDAENLPALGRQTWLRVAGPLTARRAVVCTIWLQARFGQMEEIDARICLLAGTLRFVAHPTASEVRLSFEGRAVGSGLGDNAARQLLAVIASSIERPRPVSAAG